MRLWPSTAWSFLLLCNVKESSSVICVSVVAKASCLWVAIAFSRFGAFSVAVSLNRFLCVYNIYLSFFSSLWILRCALLVISILTVSQVFLDTVVSLTYGFFFSLPSVWMWCFICPVGHPWIFFMFDWVYWRLFQLCFYLMHWGFFFLSKIDLEKYIHTHFIKISVFLLNSYSMFPTRRCL